MTTYIAHHGGTLGRHGAGSDPVSFAARIRTAAAFVWENLREWRRRSRSRRELQEWASTLTTQQLTEAGFTSNSVAQELNKPFWVA
jgi:uncharacterized protein YjiS (DUF1127 family)